MFSVGRKRNKRKKKEKKEEENGFLLLKKEAINEISLMSASVSVWLNLF